MADAPPPPPPEGSPPPPPPSGGGSFHSDWLKSDGTLNPASYDRLPEDVRYMKDTLSKYKTAEELVRGMAYTQTFAGKKGLIPLPAGSPPEVIAERKALLDGINGVPKEVKDYGITRDSVAKDLPEANWNQPLADNFVKWAHENSVSPAAVKKFITEVQLPLVKGQLAQQAQGETQFWTAEQQAFDAEIRKANITPENAAGLVEKGAIALGLDLANPQTKTFLKGKDARLMAMRHAIATGESGFVKGDDPEGGGNDPEALANSASHDKANPLYEPYYNASHPQHRMAKEKVEGWWRQAAERQGRRKQA